MKIYIAARYTRKDEVAELANTLWSNGFEVVSSWHLEPYSYDIRLKDVPDGDLCHHALRDLIEIQVSDALLFLAESEEVFNKRGGRHVEFGYALALKKKIAVIGARENIFHHLDGITHYPSVESFLTDVNGSRFGNTICGARCK